MELIILLRYIAACRRQQFVMILVFLVSFFISVHCLFIEIHMRLLFVRLVVGLLLMLFVLLFLVFILFYIYLHTRIPVSASEPRCSIISMHVICLLIDFHIYTCVL